MRYHNMEQWLYNKAYDQDLMCGLTISICISMMNEVWYRQLDFNSYTILYCGVSE